MGLFGSKPKPKGPGATNPTTKPTSGGTSSGKDLKLLLLGSGESGKSTFYKQLKAIHDKTGYTDDEIQNYKSSIYANILHCMKGLSIACMKKDNFEKDENVKRAKKILELTEDDNSLLLNAHEKYTIDIHNLVGELWKDGKVQDAFMNNRYEYHIFDGAEYFFSQFDRLAPPKYVPTADDVLRCRRKTTGLIQLTFIFESVKFTVFDVGGQRSERKKWANLYEGTSAVLFIACLSEYDQKCYEDDITNRMLETLELFDETINGNYFKDKTIVLFLNKLDVFKKKIAVKDLTCTFSDYEGGCNFEKALDYIKNKYRSANKHKGERLLIHTSCATDKSNIEEVFGTVKKELIQTILGKTV